MENKKETVPEEQAQGKYLINDLSSAIIKITDVLEYQKISDEIICKTFRKTEALADGSITVTININNISSKNLLNILNKLTDISDQLLLNEIPNDITRH